MRGDLSLINRKDVITVRVPFPNISSDLAITAHMYICKSKIGTCHEFVKCQSFKPYMLVRRDVVSYIDEDADSTRNPFKQKSRIDCDKILITTGVDYDSALRTSTRPDICDDLANQIDEKMTNNPPNRHYLNEDELVSLNRLITKII